MTYAEFERELAANQLRTAYFFLGDEEYLVEQGIRSVIDAALPGQERHFGLVEIEPGSQAEEVKRALLSPAFFGGKRVVRIRDLGKVAPEAQEALAALIHGLPRGTYLAIGGQPDKKRKAAKAVLEAVAVVDCPLLKRGEAINWAQTLAKRKGMTMNPDAAQLLVETTGARLRAIAMELEKASVYLNGERQNLTVADVRLLLGQEREDDIFRMIEAAGAGELERALQILADLIVLGEPEQVLLTLLARQVRQVLLAGYLRDSGRNSQEISGCLGVPPFVVEKLLRQAGRLGFWRCQALMERMHQADVRGKLGERDLRLELELILFAMTA